MLGAEGEREGVFAEEVIHVMLSQVGEICCVVKGQLECILYTRSKGSLSIKYDGRLGSDDALDRKQNVNFSENSECKF